MVPQRRRARQLKPAVQTPLMVLPPFNHSAGTKQDFFSGSALYAASLGDSRADTNAARDFWPMGSTSSPCSTSCWRSMSASIFGSVIPPRGDQSWESPRSKKEGREFPSPGSAVQAVEDRMWAVPARKGVSASVTGAGTVQADVSSPWVEPHASAPLSSTDGKPSSSPGRAVRFEQYRQEESRYEIPDPAEIRKARVKLSSAATQQRSAAQDRTSLTEKGGRSASTDKAWSATSGGEGEVSSRRRGRASSADGDRASWRQLSSVKALSEQLYASRSARLSSTRKSSQAAISVVPQRTSVTGRAQDQKSGSVTLELVPARVSEEKRQKQPYVRRVTPEPVTTAFDSPTAYRYDVIDQPQWVVAAEVLNRLHMFAVMHQLDADRLVGYLKRHGATQMEPEAFRLFLKKLGVHLTVAEASLVTACLSRRSHPEDVTIHMSDFIQAVANPPPLPIKPRKKAQALITNPGTFTRAPSKKLADLASNHRRRHSREQREKGWDSTLFKLERARAFKNPFETKLHEESRQSERNIKRSVALAQEKPIPTPPPLVEDVVHRIAAYVMTHEVDLAEVRLSQDCHRCGWLHPTELRPALELYGLPITTGESRAVGKFLAGLNKDQVCILSDLERVLAQYVAY